LAVFVVPTVTPVPVAPAEWKMAASGDSEHQVRTASYEANVYFSFGDIFTGEVWQVLSVLFKMRKKWNRWSVDRHIGSNIALLCHCSLYELLAVISVVKYRVFVLSCFSLILCKKILWSLYVLFSRCRRQLFFSPDVSLLHMYLLTR
jgi:hypothetical protein